MVTDQGLYEQVVKLRRKDLKFIPGKKKKKAKFKFQGQYGRSHPWFDIEFDCIQVNFITSEPDNYRKRFQSHNDTHVTKASKIFQVSIGNSKCMENSKFHNDAPMLKYCQKSLNSCCFSRLASDFAIIEQTEATNAI